MPIEQGRFILTMMPSLYCKLNCPHCYLTKEQRKSKECLELEDIKTICNKVRDYYEHSNIANKDIQIDVYWYGGEPTTMGVEMFSDMCEIINSSFAEYTVNHILLSALVGVKLSDWIQISNTFLNNEMQSSYDGLMRGQRYDDAWQKQISYLVDNNIEVTTISVFNKYIREDGAEQTLNKLVNLGVKKIGFLPFQKNTRNNTTGAFEDYSTSMHEFSEFLTEITNINAELGSPVSIGNEYFIKAMSASTNAAMHNTGGQTLFLMPNGDMVMPDYDEHNIEYMKCFGNILEQDFNSILTSSGRREWLRRQITKNNNLECLNCEYSNCCLMEFWKNNTFGDDCYGAKKYVKYILSKEFDSNQYSISNIC